MAAGAQGIRAGKAFVELYANDDKLTRGLRTAQRKLQRFSATVNKIGMSMVKFATLAAIPIALSLKIGANFEDQMSKVKAVTTGTAEEFERLNKTAKELGRTTSFTATQVSEGMVSLGRAGFSRSEIDQAISGVLNLARATDTELALAAEIAGASLRQFNLEATESGRVTDVLTATANGSAQTLEDLGEALKYAAPIAAEAGDSIEATSAAIGLMANNGIKGTMAGTALARAYKNLSADKTADMMKSIGVAVADANGNMRPMADILRDIGKATASMGNKQRLAIFEELFGRGQAAALKLANAGAKFDDMLQKIEQSGGLAAKAAKEMDNNLGGSFRKFMSAAEGIAIAIKDALEGPAMAILDYLTEVAGSITKFIEENKGLVKVIAGVIIAVGALGAALLTVGAAAGFISFAIGGLLTAGTALAGVLGFLASPMAAMLAATVAIGAALGALVSWFMKSGELFKQLGRIIMSVFGVIAAYLKSGPLSIAAKLLWETLKVIWMNGISDIGKTYEKLKEAWKSVTSAFVSDWKGAVGEVKKEMKGLEPQKGGKPGKKFDEGVIEVFELNPEQVKAEGAGNQNITPAMEAQWQQVFGFSPEQTKKMAQQANKKKPGPDDIPIMPEFAPEDPTQASKDKLAELEKQLAATKIDTSLTGLDDLKTGQEMSGTFSSMSRLIYSQGKQDKVSKDGKFLGDKLDGIKNILEDGGLD